MKSHSFLRYAPRKEKNIAYTPIFNKNFADQSNDEKNKEESSGTNEETISLKAERLAALWELAACEEVYASKNCIKVRINAVLGVASNISKNIKDIKTSVEDDTNLINLINDTLNFPNPIPHKKPNIKHSNITWQEFWVCSRIQDILSCNLVRIHQQKFKIKVTMYTTLGKFIKLFPPNPNLSLLLKSPTKKILEFLFTEILDKLKINQQDLILSTDFIIKDNFIQNSFDERYLLDFTEDFVVGKGEIAIDEGLGYIKLFYYQAFYCYKLEVQVFDKKKEFVLNQYPCHLSFLKKLQFSYMHKVVLTLFKSLEFKFIVNSLFNLE